MRRPWTLRTRLVVSAVTLIAVVAAVIGSVTAIAFHSYLYGKLDDQLRDIAVRAQRVPGVPAPGGPKTSPEHDPLGFIGMGGQPLETFGALVERGQITDSAVVKDGGFAAGENTEPLTAAQRDAVTAAGVTADDRAHDLELPGLGGYRVRAVPADDGATVLVGIPTTEVSRALGTLILVEVCVTGAGLVAAGLAGAAIVGVALRPLRRVV
ncbi:two-component sensor histidine kinase, partial [Streptomyces rubiginosohelvolus]